MNGNYEIIKEVLRTKDTSPESFERSKRKVMKKMRIFAPSKIILLKVYHKISEQRKKIISASAGIEFNKERDEEIKRMLITRPVRSLSGLVNISVLTKPYPCPGKCIYCPNKRGMPKSYLKSEPAAMRAVMNDFDPKKQVDVRIKSLQMTGHPVDKIEMRIVGGTWSFYPKKYQEKFVKELFDVCNRRVSETLKEAQRRNERSKHRIVGLSVETRPDFVTPEEISRFRELGITSVELGVQAIDDTILRIIKRGHDVKSIITATKLLKDAGLKVCYQIMPNLPGSDIKKDEEIFKTLFSNPDFRPDYLKIYPTAVMKGTELYKIWKEGKYLSYSNEEIKSLLKRMLKSVPSYVRIQRMIRDIPIQEIKAGTTISNMREVIARESKDEGWLCGCIRCREVKEFYNSDEKILLSREDYEASQGKEIFLTFESKDRKKLYSLLRLRISSRAMIRELHTYGRQLAIKSKGASPQHKGLGKKLMAEAEKIARNEFNFNKISVISSVGTRDYYRKMGYRLNKTYMVKALR